ncbi:BTAD domain-containing putative transcriptional regulator, partial [Streptomyces sp. NPDC047014]|uniref:BTAD domain-containing putative transcriptional regulator n=1 Tax=Streptomyces sp. NPDC047014 TaxID=3155736 RepID=UPI003403DD71
MVRVRVLGPLDVVVGGQPAPIGRRRQRTVLGLLLTARGRAVPVDHIIDAVWADRPPAKPLNSLHAYVSNLRGVLEPGRRPRGEPRVLISSPQGYALRLPEDAVDAWTFEAEVARARTLPPREAVPVLEAALGLWRGEAYAEWGRETWAAAETARLTELRLLAAESAMSGTLGAGRPQEVVPTAEAHVHRHPLREEGWRLLALALWATGRQGDALAALRRSAAVSAEELGLDPGPSLTTLEQAILTRRLDILRESVPLGEAEPPLRAGGAVAAAATQPGETAAPPDPHGPGATTPHHGVAVAALAPEQHSTVAAAVSRQQHELAPAPTSEPPSAAAPDLHSPGAGSPGAVGAVAAPAPEPHGAVPAAATSEHPGAPAAVPAGSHGTAATRALEPQGTVVPEPYATAATAGGVAYGRGAAATATPGREADGPWAAGRTSWPMAAEGPRAAGDGGRAGASAHPDLTTRPGSDPGTGAIPAVSQSPATLPATETTPADRPHAVGGAHPAAARSLGLPGGAHPPGPSAPNADTYAGQPGSTHHTGTGTGAIPLPQAGDRPHAVGGARSYGLPAPGAVAYLGRSDGGEGAWADGVPGGAFVGRERELGVLAQAACAAVRGGAVVLVAGEAGAGKTALLGQFGERLRGDGWVVVGGRCPDGDGAPAAWAWVEALGELAEVMPPERVGPLSPLLDPDGLAPAPQGDATAGRFRLHRAFTRWLVAAAERRPLAVFVDDLHEADQETLALLGLAAAVDGVPLLVVAAYRPGHDDPRLAPLMASLARLSPFRLALGGLEPADIGTLLRALCGRDIDPEVVHALAERTGGNPFYVGESARLLLGSDPAAAAVAGVPEGIRDVVRQRLARLPEDAADVLRLAAVAGSESHVAVLCSAADSPAPAVVDSLDACVTAGLLTEPGPGRVRFAHPLLRDTVYSDLTRVRRGLLHGRLADAVHRLRPDDLPALALHFTRSGDPAQAARAVSYALRAAELAGHRYAHDVSADLLRHAVEAAELIPESGDERAERAVGLLGALMRAQIRAGSGDSAVRTRRRALDTARAAGREDLAVAAFTAWTEPTPWLTRDHGTVDAHAVDTLERLAARPDLPPADLARLLQALVDELPGDAGAQALDAAERQLALARRAQDPALLAAALTTMTKLLPHEDQAARCVPVVAELRALTKRHDLPAYRWVCEQADAMTAAIGNDAAAVERHARHGLAVARRYRMPEAEAASLSTLAMLAHARGAFTEAEELYEQVRERLVRHNAPRAADLHARGIITIRLSQGRITEIEPQARALHAAWGTRGGEALALVLALQGKLDEARAVPFDPLPVPDHFYGVRLGARARLACLLGDTGAAAALVPLLEPLREQLGSAATTAFCTRPLALALGELHALLGEVPAARSAYLAAAEVARLWGSAQGEAAARAAAAA